MTGSLADGLSLAARPVRSRARPCLVQGQMAVTNLNSSEHSSSPHTNAGPPGECQWAAVPVSAHWHRIQESQPEMGQQSLSRIEFGFCQCCHGETCVTIVSLALRHICHTLGPADSYPSTFSTVIHYLV